MEKPKRPKKPKAPTVREPQERVTDHYYPYDNDPDYDHTRRRLVFYAADDIPGGDFDYDQEMQDWYDANSAKGELSLQKLVDFANSKGVSLDDVIVSAIIPHREADYTELEVMVTRTRSAEEMECERNHYNEVIAAYNAKLSEYEEAKAAYPRRKAEWELFQAQQKLNELQGSQ